MGDGLRDGEGPDNGLLAELYDELRVRAEHVMRGQPKNGTLQPTALVNEACLKLMSNGNGAPTDRAHLLAVACKAMRSVLVDHARARSRAKRSAPGERLPLDAISVAYEARAIDILALQEALERLQLVDPEMVRAVDLMFFGGLSQEEAARTLVMPQRTFERRWQFARAWLRAEIG